VRLNVEIQDSPHNLGVSGFASVASPCAPLF
jgi:hypothetical protein